MKLTAVILSLEESEKESVYTRIEDDINNCSL